jgi:hypothetical protein
MKKLAAGVAVTCLLAGCGGGAPLSKADFQAKANAICSKYNARIKAALANTSNGPKSIANGVDRAMKFVKKGVDELDDLEPPKQYDAKFKEFSRINHDELSAGKDLADAARANSKSRLRSALVKLGSQERDADRLATQMGLDTCASG